MTRRHSDAARRTATSRPALANPYDTTSGQDTRPGRALRTLAGAAIVTGAAIAMSGTAAADPDESSGFPDGGIADSGISDSGISDSGISDSGISDSGISDSGISDSGISDSGISDSGISDSGISDSGISDSGIGDSGIGDVPVEISSPPVGTTPVGTPSVGTPSVGTPPVETFDQQPPGAGPLVAPGGPPGNAPAPFDTTSPVDGSAPTDPPFTGPGPTTGTAPTPESSTPLLPTGAPGSAPVQPPPVGTSPIEVADPTPTPTPGPAPAVEPTPLPSTTPTPGDGSVPGTEPTTGGPVTGTSAPLDATAVPLFPSPTTEPGLTDPTTTPPPDPGSPTTTPVTGSTAEPTPGTPTSGTTTTTTPAEDPAPGSQPVPSPDTTPIPEPGPMVSLDAAPVDSGAPAVALDLDAAGAAEDAVATGRIGTTDEPTTAAVEAFVAGGRDVPGAPFPLEVPSGTPLVEVTPPPVAGIPTDNPLPTPTPLTTTPTDNPLPTPTPLTTTPTDNPLPTPTPLTTQDALPTPIEPDTAPVGGTTTAPDPDVAEGPRPTPSPAPVPATDTGASAGAEPVGAAPGGTVVGETSGPYAGATAADRVGGSPNQDGAVPSESAGDSVTTSSMGITPQGIAVAGAVGVGGQWLGQTIQQAAGRAPAVTAGKIAKGTTAAGLDVALTPRQERALSALNREPLATLGNLDEFASTMGPVGRRVAQGAGSEAAYGLLNTVLTAGSAPLGPAGAIPAAGVAKLAQKEQIDPLLARVLADAPPSEVLAGPDGAMLRPGDTRGGLVDPLGERITSTPIDDMLTAVDGRPLTTGGPVLVGQGGQPLTAPNPLERLGRRVAALTAGSPVRGPDGGPVPSAPPLRGADGRPLAPMPEGSVLRPRTIVRDAAVDEVVGATARQERAARNSLGIPESGDLVTTVPRDVDPVALERAAVEATTGTAAARRAAADIIGGPEGLSASAFTPTPGTAPRRTGPGMRSTASALGEAAKTGTRAGLTALGVPSTATDAAGALLDACIGAMCTAVGRTVESVVRGTTPSVAALGDAALADATGQLTRAAVTLEPDKLLDLAAVTGAGYLARTVGPPSLPGSAATPVAGAAGPARTGAPRPGAGLGALTTAVAAPFVEQGLRQAGILPTDPLQQGWWPQTLNVGARATTGCLTGLTSRADCITGALAEGSSAFFDQTTLGGRAARFAETDGSAAAIPVNMLRQLGNLNQLAGSAFETTGQVIGTALAFTGDTLDGGHRMPVEDYLTNLDDMSGPRTTRADLERARTTGALIDSGITRALTTVPPPTPTPLTTAPPTTAPVAPTVQPASRVPLPPDCADDDCAVPGPATPGAGPAALRLAADDPGPDPAATRTSPTGTPAGTIPPPPGRVVAAPIPSDTVGRVSPALTPTTAPPVQRPGSRYPVCGSDITTRCIDPTTLYDTDRDGVFDNHGIPILGSTVGPALVGERLVGPALVGERLVGPALVGERLVGPALVGERLVGPALVGERLVGPALVGEGRVGPGPAPSPQPAARARPTAVPAPAPSPQQSVAQRLTVAPRSTARPQPTAPRPTTAPPTAARTATQPVTQRPTPRQAPPPVRGPAVQQTAPRPDPLQQAITWGRENVVAPLNRALDQAADTARQFSRTVVVDVRPYEGFDELHHVTLLDGAAGVYDANGVLVYAEQGTPPARVPSWRLRIDPGLPAGAGFPALSPGGVPIPAPIPIPIR